MSLYGVNSSNNFILNHFFQAKVNNASQIGVSYQQKVRNGVTMTLSSLVEGKNFNQGGHKVGLGLDFEA